MQTCSLKECKGPEGPSTSEKTSPMVGILINFATEHEINDNLDKSLIHLILDKLKIQNDLTRNILKGKPIPRSWD